MASSSRMSHRFLHTARSPLTATRQAPRHIFAQTSRRNAYSSASQPASLLKTALYTAGIAASGYLVYIYSTDTRASLHRWLVPPVLRFLYPDAEDGHHAGVASMKTLYSLGLHVRERAPIGNDPALALIVFGHPLSNPVGISAGLDKHAEIPDALFALGAGVVEVGGCTPLPQPGNPKPRMFRIPGLDGFINRYGLNSHGADDMAIRLRNRVRLFAKSIGLSEDEVLNGVAGVPAGSLKEGKLLAVQIAKNKNTPGDDVAAVSRDYTYCVSRLAPYADILVVNVSSPNTPGLRDLQAVEPLTKILSAVVDEARRANRRSPPKIMVKVSPDEDEDTQMEGIVQAVWQSGVDGVIVGNTTNRRSGIVPPGVVISPKEALTLSEAGGYSGPMMFERTLDLVKRYRKMLDGTSKSSLSPQKVVDHEAVGVSLAGIDGNATGLISDAVTTTAPEGDAKGGIGGEQKVIFATGGITNGEQALKILNAGASVAMVYTALAYGGAGTITRIKEEMKENMVGKTA